MNSFIQWLENKFDIIEPNDDETVSRGVVKQNQIGTKSGIRVNRGNKLPFGMSEYPRKKLIENNTLIVKKIQEGDGQSTKYTISNMHLDVLIEIPPFSALDNRIYFFINHERPLTQDNEEYLNSSYRELANLICSIFKVEIKKIIEKEIDVREGEDKVNYFTTELHCGQQNLYQSTKIASSKMDQIVKSVSKGEFSCPYGPNEIEETKINAWKGSYQFDQHFSRQIDNDIDYRPTDTVPEDYYA